MVFWALALRLPYWPQLLPLCHPSHLIRRVQRVPLRGMAYELGAGLGVAIFGLMLSWFYSRSIILPAELPSDLIEKASISIGETMQLASNLENPLGGQLVVVAQQAFSYAHSWVLTLSAICFFLLTVFVWFSFPKKVN